MTKHTKLTTEQLNYLEVCLELIKSRKGAVTRELIIEFQKKYPEINLTYCTLKNQLHKYQNNKLCDQSKPITLSSVSISQNNNEKHSFSTPYTSQEKSTHRIQVIELLINFNLLYCLGLKI